ncbi:MAG: hypothetical protein IT353_11330 [Gemmatimonadaceae bacterium]|nr:hypothetical protein [Gemmatimonadaceae bacterium]
MQLWQRARGLLGSALTWGAVGAVVGTTVFVLRFQPWQSALSASRLLTRFAAFAGAGALWGAACGLAFGIVVVMMGRRRGMSSLSAATLTLWGAIGGAAFPLLLYTPVVLSRGAYGLIPLYGMLTGVSALLGALCGRAIFSLARRAPKSPIQAVLSGASPLDGDHHVAIHQRERVR